MGINDWGSAGERQNAPKLGSPGGWADSVAKVLDGRDASVDTRIADHAAALDPHPGYMTPAELAQALLLYAPLESPALTGNPTAPTAAQGTATTQVATTAHVATEVGLLVPKALYDANSTVVADSDNTPKVLAIPASSLVGRGAAGNIAALSVADVRTLVGTTRVTRPNTDDLLIEVYDATLGWVTTKYDSGVRDIAASLTNSWVNNEPGGLGMLMRRVDSRVYLMIHITGGSDPRVILTPATGFEPFRAHQATAYNSSTGDLFTNSAVWVHTTANNYLRLLGTLQTFTAQIDYETTAARPTSLPGTLVSAAPLT